MIERNPLFRIFLGSFCSLAAAFSAVISTPALAHAQYSFSYATVDPPGATAGANASNVSFASAISASGTVVGYYTDNTVDRGYLLKNGVYTVINAPGASHGTDPSGIDDAGDVVGTYYDANHKPVGFVDRDGAITSFTVPGAVGTTFGNINESGLAAVDYVDAAGAASSAIYNVNTQALSLLPNVPGFAASYLQTVGANGNLLYNVTDGTGASHGLLDNNGIDTVLNFPIPGVESTYTDAMTSTGIITGNYQDAQGATYGFFYDSADDSWYTLDVPGATTTILLTGNNDHQFAGFYADPDGAYHSLIVTASGNAPEPGSLALVCPFGVVGFVMFRLRRRCRC